MFINIMSTRDETNFVLRMNYIDETRNVMNFMQSILQYIDVGLHTHLFVVIIFLFIDTFFIFHIKDILSMGFTLLFTTWS